MAITETKLTADRYIKIEGYRWIGRPRRNKQGGGIGLLIKDSLANQTTIHVVGEEELEILWIKIKRKQQQPVMIGLYYGKQESRTTKTEAEYEVNEIKTQIENIQTETDEIILIGDFNAKIGRDQSRNGKIIEEYIIQDCNLKLVNGSEKCIGHYTRVNTANPDEKSAIDFVFVSTKI